MDNKIDKSKIHTHPRMEKECHIPDGHVIIDTELWLDILKLHEMYPYGQSASRHLTRKRKDTNG